MSVTQHLPVDRVQAIIQSIGDAVIVSDENGNLQLFNRAAEDILGVGLTDASPDDWSNTYGVYLADGETLCPTQDLPLARAIRGETVDKMELVIHNPNLDVMIPISCRATPIRDEADKLTGGVVIFHDITERKQHEVALSQTRDQLEVRVAEQTTELRKREELLSLLLNSTAEAIYGLDLKGNCTFHNPACSRLLGYDETSDLIGKNMHELIHHTRRDGSPYPEEECPIYQAFRRGERTHADDEVLWRTDGTCFAAEYWSYPIFQEGQLVGSVVTFLDITSRRGAEDQVRQHQAELMHVSRLSTMGEMAAGLAHELNQPLAAIAAYASGSSVRLRNGGLPTEQLAEVFENISSDAHRAGEVIRRLRKFVQKREVELVAVDLNELVREVCDFVRPEAKQRQVRFGLDLADKTLMVRADSIEIQQVLLNLIRNAFDALPSAEGTQPWISIQTLQPSEAMAEVVVGDSGSGISAQMRQQVFEAFFTSKQEGLGMGLAISRTIIDSHGGKIWIEEVPEGGTTIHFSLPIAWEGAEDV